MSTEENTSQTARRLEQDLNRVRNEFEATFSGQLESKKDKVPERKDAPVKYPLKDSADVMIRAHQLYVLFKFMADNNYISGPERDKMTYELGKLYLPDYQNNIRVLTRFLKGEFKQENVLVPKLAREFLKTTTGDEELVTICLKSALPYLALSTQRAAAECFQDEQGLAAVDKKIEDYFNERKKIKMMHMILARDL